MKIGSPFGRPIFLLVLYSLIMKKSLLFPLLLISVFLYSQGQIDKRSNPVVEFIEAIQTADKEKIAQHVSYPLKRKYPLPAVEHEADFVLRFDEIFDKELMDKIINSDPQNDWSKVGWRGIMLSGGVLWLDTEGRLLAINRLSQKEKERREAMIEENRLNLHVSILRYKAPILQLETEKFRVRIDDLGDGNYRYVSWPIDKTMRDQPSLVLKKGEVFFEGTGSNHRYEFKSGPYTYIIAIHHMAEDGFPPAHLRVLKKEERILNQAAIRLER